MNLTLEVSGMNERSIAQVSFIQMFVKIIQYWLQLATSMKRIDSSPSEVIQGSYNQVISQQYYYSL